MSTILNLKSLFRTGNRAFVGAAFLFLGIAAVGGTGVGGMTRAHAQVTVGIEAPAFSATNADGKQVSLSDFAGKFVVLEWFNPTCPFVKKHYNSSNMQGLQKKYSAKDVVWLVVSSTAPGKTGHLSGEEAKASIAEQKGSPTDIIIDPTGGLGKLYGAKTTPHMFVIDPQGKLIYAGAIDNNDSVRPDSIPEDTNYVAAALDEAMSGKPVSVSSSRPYGCSVKYAA